MPTHRTSRSLRCDLSPSKKNKTLRNLIYTSVFLSVAVPTINLSFVFFYTTLSEAVPSIIMTVIPSHPLAASATETTPQLLLTKWIPLILKMRFSFHRTRKCRLSSALCSSKGRKEFCLFSKLDLKPERAEILFAYRKSRDELKRLT